VPIGIDRRFNAAPKRRRHEGPTALGIRFASDSLVEGKQDSKPRQVDGALFHSRWFTNGEKHRSHYSDIVGPLPPTAGVLVVIRDGIARSAAAAPLGLLLATTCSRWHARRILPCSIACSFPTSRWRRGSRRARAQMHRARSRGTEGSNPAPSRGPEASQARTKLGGFGNRLRADPISPSAGPARGKADFGWTQPVCARHCSRSVIPQLLQIRAAV
jgi:hypothetical protein